MWRHSNPSVPSGAVPGIRSNYPSQRIKKLYGRQRGLPTCQKGTKFLGSCFERFVILCESEQCGVSENPLERHKPDGLFATEGTE